MAISNIKIVYLKIDIFIAVVTVHKMLVISNAAASSFASKMVFRETSLENGLEAALLEDHRGMNK